MEFLSSFALGLSEKLGLEGLDLGLEFTEVIGPIKPEAIPIEKLGVPSTAVAAGTIEKAVESDTIPWNRSGKLIRRAPRLNHQLHHWE